MSTTELITIASFLLYTRKNYTPRDAIELAVIDTRSAIALSKNYDFIVRAAKRSVFSFLHPEVKDRIKYAAFLLVESYLNFDALNPGELKEITDYLDAMKEYFN